MWIQILSRLIFRNIVNSVILENIQSTCEQEPSRDRKEISYAARYV